MGLKVTNNAFGALNAGINSTDTVIVLEAGQGARFPVLGAGDYFYATLIDTSNQLEIVKVTARATDTMTVVRAQDGTSSRAYNVNDRFELRPTAALFNEKLNVDNPSYTGTLTGTGGASIEGLTVGRGAGNVSTNTAVGASALAANTTGNQNTAVGNFALRDTTTGTRNTAVGYEAMILNTTGGSNTAVGRLSLALNTTGGSNAALGLEALYANTTGNFNTAIGTAALQANTTAPNNTAVGYQAGFSNTTAFNNVAVGSHALYSNTTGSYNCAVGAFGLYFNTTGINNTALGAPSSVNSGDPVLYSNTTGSQNIGIGPAAMFNNTTGNNNIGVGFRALYSNTTGGSNTALGHFAGFTVNEGFHNVLLGSEAGYGAVFLTTGSRNILIGYGASSASSSSINEIVIGGNGTIVGKGSNTGFIAPGATTTNGGGGVFQGNNSSSWSTTSDERIKQNFAAVTNGLEIINALEPFEFDYIVGEKHDVGFKAQQYATVLPEQVSKHLASPEEKAIVGEDEIYGIQRNLDPYLVSAIKALTERLEAAEAEIAALKGTQP